MADRPAELKGPLKGHALAYEGQPFNAEGRLMYGWLNGVGRGKCSCGELSPALLNNAQRQRWHRQHKAEVAGDKGGERA